jgi:hypothetical protein
LYDKAAELVDHRIGWDHLPKAAGLLDLIGIRDTLREKNPYDNSRPTRDLPLRGVQVADGVIAVTWSVDRCTRRSCGRSRAGTPHDNV